MINNKIENAIDNVVKELLELNDKKIKKAIRQMNKEGIEENIVNQIVRFAVMKSISIEPDSRDSFIYEQLDFVLKQLSLAAKAYCFEVRLLTDGLDSIRKFTIPAYFTMADLAYSVIAAYHGDGSHLFSLKYRKIQYMMDYDYDYPEEFDDASFAELGMMNFRKGSCIHMEYDFGASWEFEICFTGSKTVDQNDNIPVLEDGEGVNIWEDCRDFLNLLSSEPNKDISDFVGEKMTIQELAELEGVCELTENQIDEFADMIIQLKSQYEDNDYSDELN